MNASIEGSRKEIFCIISTISERNSMEGILKKKIMF
jgi:hypothetical protein